MKITEVATIKVPKWRLPKHLVEHPLEYLNSPVIKNDISLLVKQVFKID